MWSIDTIRIFNRWEPNKMLCQYRIDVEVWLIIIASDKKEI